VSRWALLLRAVNVGGNNKLPMAELKRVLEGLGHRDVKTYLNSGNATFTSAKKDPSKLADAVEKALENDLGLTVRAVVRSAAQVKAMVDAVPEDLEGYVLVSVLFDVPDPLRLKEIQRWEPETVKPGDGCLYLAYQSVNGSKLTNALIEKRLGVGTTARTPGTLRKLLG
jgi:uncharacterized protein (DUF1697 family)